MVRAGQCPPRARSRMKLLSHLSPHGDGPPAPADPRRLALGFEAWHEALALSHDDPSYGPATPVECHPRRQAPARGDLWQQPVSERRRGQRMGVFDPPRRRGRRPRCSPRSPPRSRTREDPGEDTAGVDAPAADRQAPNRAAGRSSRARRRVVARRSDARPQPLRRGGARRSRTSSAASGGGPGTDHARRASRRRKTTAG